MPVIRAYGELCPKIDPSAFVADNATIVGDVEIAAGGSVWFGAVLRGDVGYVRIGPRSNVQDLSLLHMTLDTSNTELGCEVSVGHGVIIHGARIGDGALIGMGAILLDNVEIGAEAIVGAGAVLPPRMVVPPRTLVLGQPGKVVRDLTPAEWRQGREIALRYVSYSERHRMSAQVARSSG